MGIFSRIQTNRTAQNKCDTKDYMNYFGVIHVSVISQDNHKPN